MRLDAVLALMKDRADRQVVLEVFERLLDFCELHPIASQRRRILPGEVGTQQIPALAAVLPA